VNDWPTVRYLTLPTLKRMPTITLTFAWVWGIDGGRERVGGKWTGFQGSIGPVGIHVDWSDE